MLNKAWRKKRTTRLHYTNPGHIYGKFENAIIVALLTAGTSKSNGDAARVLPATTVTP